MCLPVQLPSLHLHLGEAGFRVQNGRVSFSGDTKRDTLVIHSCSVDQLSDISYVAPQPFVTTKQMERLRRNQN